MIIIPTTRWVRKSGNSAWSPLDNANVVEIYNAMDTSKHTYVPARTAVSYTTTAGVTTFTVAENPCGFSISGVGDDVVIDVGDAEVDGEWVVTGVSGATFTFANPLGTPTGSPVNVTGTVNWKHKKVSQVAGMKGIYNFTQATLSSMPQWNATTKEMIWLRAYHLLVDNSLRNAVSVVGGPRTILAVCRRTANNGGPLGIAAGNSTIDLRFLGNSINAIITNRTTLTWSDAAASNGNMKLLAFNGDTALQELYHNNMVTPAASSANNGTCETASPASIYIGYASGTNLVGSCNAVVFANGLLDQAYRENFKAWCEASPRSVVFG